MAVLMYYRLEIPPLIAKEKGKLFPFFKRIWDNTYGKI